MRDIFDNAGSAFRIYRNTLFVLALDAGSYAGLEKQLRRFLALEDIAGDESLSLSPSAQQDLKGKLDEVKKNLSHSIITAYRHVAWRGNSNGQVVWRDMGIPVTGQTPSLSQRVWQFLKDEERILSSLTPRLILERAFGKEETEKSLEEIYDVFLKTPGLPCLEGDEVLKGAISQGARTGLLGVRLGSKLYFGEIPSDLSLDAVVVRPEKAKEEKKTEIDIKEGPDRDHENGKPRYEVMPGGEGEVKENGESLKYNKDKDNEEGKPVQPYSPLIKQVSIKATIPWDKLSQVVAGVIRPLVARGSEPEITLEIKAESEQGFDRTTLDSKVKETLQQLNSEIVEWKEK